MNTYKPIFLLLSIALIACTEQGNNPKSWGSALQNGEEWEAEGRATYNLEVHGGGINLQFWAQITKSNNDHLSFSAYPDSVGKYEVMQRDYDGGSERKWYRNGRYVIIEGGDALGDKYVVLNKDDNFFEITSVNGPEVKGRFRVTFVRDTTDHTIRNPELADTLRFTDGEFVVFVEED